MIIELKYHKIVKDTVRRKTKSCDPINPPRIVIHSLDAKFVLNICIPAKVSTVNVVANRNDVYDGRAVIQIKPIRSKENSPKEQQQMENFLPMLKGYTQKGKRTTQLFVPVLRVRKFATFPDDIVWAIMAGQVGSNIEFSRFTARIEFEDV